MALGLDIVIPAVDDPTLEWADDDDALLVPGSLALIDPAHSANPWPAGVPANGAILPNIAWKRLKDLLGVGDATSLGFTFVDNHQAADATFERTAKGGLHTAYSQTTNTNNNRGGAIVAPTTLRDYLFANSGHNFYFSRWGKTTRLSAASGPPRASLGAAVPATNYLMQITRLGGVLPDTGSPHFIDKDRSPGAETVGNDFVSLGFSGWTGTAPGAASGLNAFLFLFGNHDAYASSANNKSPSLVTYRIYMEDLTVSGRSYDAVQAADFALWQAAMAAGGRYGGDTHSDPPA